MHVQQRLIIISSGRLSARRKRKMMVKVMRFLQLAAVHQQNSVPHRLSPEMSRPLLRENRFFPVSLLTRWKNEAHHGKPSTHEAFPHVVLVPRVLYLRENLSGINVNLVAESAVVVRRLLIGMSRAYERRHAQRRQRCHDVCVTRIAMSLQ